METLSGENGLCHTGKIFSNVIQQSIKCNDTYCLSSSSKQQRPEGNTAPVRMALLHEYEQPCCMEERDKSNQNSFMDR